MRFRDGAHFHEQNGVLFREIQISISHQPMSNPKRRGEDDAGGTTNF
jgi:hypothetical protein